MAGDLRSDIAHWKFLDSRSRYLPWVDVRHSIVKPAMHLISGGVAPMAHIVEGRNNWQQDVRDQSIAVKEALALINILEAGSSTLSNC